MREGVKVPRDWAGRPTLAASDAARIVAGYRAAVEAHAAELAEYDRYTKDRTRRLMEAGDFAYGQTAEAELKKQYEMKPSSAFAEGGMVFTHPLSLWPGGRAAARKAALVAHCSRLALRREPAPRSLMPVVDATRAQALSRFERRTAVPMLILALAIIPLLIAPLIWELSPGTETTLAVVDAIIWGAFAVEYAVRLYLSPDRGRFVRSHKLDLVLIVLPFLRPLRVVRSVRAVRLLSAARATAFLWRGFRTVKAVLTRHKLHYALAVTVVIVLTAAFIVAALEGGSSESNITSFGDALWWAITTVTTVGYGDRFPVTAAGRALAAVLMVVGIALFGFLAGALASFFLERREETEVDPKLAEMNERLKRIEEALEISRGDRAGQAGP